MKQYYVYYAIMCKTILYNTYYEQNQCLLKKIFNITVSLHIILKLKAKNIIFNRPIDQVY